MSRIIGRRAGDGSDEEGQCADIASCKRNQHGETTTGSRPAAGPDDDDRSFVLLFHH